MDWMLLGAGAIAGAAAGWGYGAALGPLVATRRAAWFWVAAVIGMLVGVGVAIVGRLTGVEAGVWAGFAFAAVSASALKWRSGKVPGVRAGIRDD